MKKGFTLIELLAVIVILAVIALISTPIIIRLIDDARKETFKTSAYGIVKAGEIFYAKNMMNGTIEEIAFSYEDGGETSSVADKKLDYNGTKPKSGSVVINSEGQVAIAIHNGTYCTEKSYEDSEVTLSDKTAENCIVILLPNGKLCGDDFVDSRDSKIYKTVQIGIQCWMAENLRYIGNGCTSKTWDSGAPHDACKSDTTSWGEEILYQWGAAMNGSTTEGAQGACPDGWHLPTDAEWTTLTNFVGTEPGTKLKATTPIWNGTNTVGFNAKPAGYRSTGGSVNVVGSYGSWWTSSISGSYAWDRSLNSGTSAVNRSGSSQAVGYSVRCLLGQ